ncbi:MAG: ribosomal protein S18-alanine N-acetyltransferase [candidate division KSB1 bacterium]|nr:ribosomal protein S18-alanine N-acetyltransferase [candidate division KSB1 bacterium]
MAEGIEVPLSDGKKYHIRWMTPADVPVVWKLEQEVFASPWAIENFLYELGNHDYNISLIAVMDQHLAGYSVSYHVYDELHISNLAVGPNFRRRKIGETILVVNLTIARIRSINHVHLEVRRSNFPAIALYQKYGFEIVGVRKNYYQNEREDALLMTKKLTME